MLPARLCRAALIPVNLELDVAFLVARDDPEFKDMNQATVRAP